jgi:hypothetical protein
MPTLSNGKRALSGLGHAGGAEIPQVIYNQALIVDSEDQDRFRSEVFTSAKHGSAREFRG